MDGTKRIIKNEIDLSCMMWKFLAQWKAVAIVCIISAALCASVKLYIDIKAYDAENNNSKNIMPVENLDDKVEQILSEFDSNERASIEQIIRMDQWIADRADYMDNSVLFNLDPFNVKSLVLDYNISDITNESDITAIKTAYAQMFDDVALTELADVISPGCHANYIKELISVEEKISKYSVNPSIQVSILMPMDINEKEVFEIVDKTIYNRHKIVSSKIPHALTLISEDTVYEFNQEVEEKKNDELYWNYNFQVWRNSAINSLSEEQSAALQEINVLLDLTRNTNKEEIGNNIAMDDAVRERPHLRLKFALLGFVLGFFLYFFIYVILIYLGDKVFSKNNAQLITDTFLIGEIYNCDKRSLLLKSDFINKIRYGNKLNTSKQIELMNNKLKKMCKKAGVSEVTLFNFTNETELQKYFIDDSLQDIKMHYINVEEEIENIYIMDAENIVYLVEDSTPFRLLRQAVTEVYNSGKKPMGLVYYQSV